MNVVVLQGALAGEVNTRQLPSGEVVYQFDLRAPFGEVVEAVPVSVGPGMPEPSGEPGDELVVVGRVRRRFFRVGGGTQSRTEVVADQVIPARLRKRVAGVMGASCTELAGIAERRGAPAG